MRRLSRVNRTCVHRAARFVSRAVALLLLTSAVGVAQIAESDFPLLSVRSVLRLGANGDLLGRPQIVGTLSDGSVVVLDAAEPNILLFSRDAHLRSRIGGRGRGPGEFLTVGGAGIVSDSIWVWDPQNSRLSIFDVAGKLVYERTIAALIGNRERYTIASVVGVLPGRRLAVIQDPHASVKRGGSFERLTLMVDPLGATILDTIARTNVAERTVVIPGVGIGPLPFTPVARGPIQVAADGRLLTVADVDVAGPGRGVFTLNLRQRDGSQVKSSVLFRPRTTPRDSLTALFFARLPDARRQEGARAALELPPLLPPVTAAFIDERGRVWLRREDFQKDGFEWFVFNESLKPIGRFRLPRNANPQFPSGGYLWAIEEQADGEQLLVGFRFF